MVELKWRCGNYLYLGDLQVGHAIEDVPDDGIPWFWTNLILGEGDLCPTLEEAKAACEQSVKESLGIEQ